MSNSYWATTLQNRLSRRRALAGAATVGAGALAASLVACGGGDDGGGGGGVYVEPQDTTKQAVRGGNFQNFFVSEGPNFDPAPATSWSFNHNVLASGRLLRYKQGTVFAAPDGSVEGDIMNAWEISQDGLQVTMKLRPNNKLDQRAPTSGRAFSMEDVKYSWERWSRLSPDRGNLLTAVQPLAPVDSVSFPDATTMVLKLAFPHAGILRRFAGNIYFAPVESETGYDLRQEIRGTGPWMLTKQERSVGWGYERNPNWWGNTGSGVPYLDGINYAIMPEVAVQQAQFQAKRLWFLKPTADTVVTLKGDNPGALLQAAAPIRTGANLAGNSSKIGISKLADSPLQKDVRLRYALSMLLDRDAWIDTFFNVAKLEAEGLPMETAWHSHIGAWAYEWLDPKAGKLGEGSKYFQHNPAEAVKLLKAAGKYPFETEASYSTSNTNPVVPRQWEVYNQMWQEGGHVKLKVNTGDYITWFQPQYNRRRAQNEGVYYALGTAGGPDVDASIWGMYAPNSGDDCVYEWDRVPGMQDIMVRHQRERDTNKRIAIAEEFQKFMATAMPSISAPGSATSFTFYHPFMGNGGVYRSWSGAGDAPDTWINVWYDKSKGTPG